MPRTATTVVRCLDCGTEYRLESHGGEAGPCPHCGGVGWVALEACGRKAGKRNAAKRKFR